MGRPSGRQPSISADDGGSLAGPAAPPSRVDEPDASLDPETSASVLGLLREISRERGSVA